MSKPLFVYYAKKVAQVLLHPQHNTFLFNNLEAQTEMNYSTHYIK